MIRSSRHSEPTTPVRGPRGPRFYVGIAGPGGATIAFLLLILCGVSGAAVLDPAFGAWGAAISSRVENLRAARAVASESRLSGARLDGRIASSTLGTIETTDVRGVAHGAWSADARAMTKAGLLDLPPPTIG